MAESARVLVTGGCGFIGANLVRFLSEREGCSVRVVDDLRAGDRAHVPGAADVRIGDVSHPQVLDDALQGVDAVVHLASQTGVAPSVEDPVRDFEGNALTTFRVLEACRARGIDRFVFASSGAAIGDAPPPLHEELVPRPVSPYGAGKLVGEAYCRAYAGSFGMMTVALRFSNVYGPLSAHKKNAIPLFIKRCLRGEAIDVYGDGSQTRDFIHVHDLCDAIARALGGEGISGEVFQLGTGVETSIRELTQLVQEVAGPAAEVRFHPRRPGEVHRSVVDLSKARRLLGFEPGTTLRAGLESTAEWYRGHGVTDRTA
ncbi:MAG TPA: NAD-dependent epimerase/dehydratase family protein [Actinomycetota bacterium]|nr:NAD-dependent epimerase/dehydratase family protein [Actinomycetota bacterium]